MSDLATLEFAIDPRRAEQGARKITSALDAVEKKALAVIATVKKINNQLDIALNGSGKGRGSATARVVSDALKLTAQINAELAKREAAERQHGQRLLQIRESTQTRSAQIEARRLTQLAAIHARAESAEARHAQRTAEFTKRGPTSSGVKGFLGESLALATRLGTALTALAGIGGAGSLFAGFVRSGVEFNRTLETSEIGIASIIASLNEFRNDEGIKLKGIDELNAALPLAREQIEKLRIAGLETAATTEDLVTGFQQALGPGLAAGLKLDEIRNLTVDITQAATALRVPLREIGQETRAILSGNIDRNARIAQALGLNNELVKSLKEQNKLGQELTRRFEVFRASGAKIAQTFEGVVSNFREATQVVAGRGTEQLTGTITARLQNGIKSLIDTKNLDIDGDLKPLLDLFDSFSAKAAGKVFDLFDAILRELKDLGDFIEENRGLIEDTTTSVGFLQDSIVDLASIGGSRLKVDLQKEVRDLKSLIDFVTGGVVFLQDAFELFVAGALYGIKGVTIALESALAGALDFVGIRITALSNDIARLRGDLAALEGRANEGNRHTRAFYEAQQRQRDLRAITVDAGNAVPIDPATGRPLTRRGVVDSALTRFGFEPEKRTRSAGGGRSGRSRDSEERAIRSAAETLENAKLKAYFDQREKLIKNVIEVQKEGYDRGLIAAGQYYDTLLQYELKLQGIEKSRVRGELASAQQRLDEIKGKDKSLKGAEALRAQAQIIELTSRLNLIDADRVNILRRINNEREKAIKLAEDEGRAAIAAAAVTNFNLNKKVVDTLAARQDGAFSVAQAQLRAEEEAIRGQQTRGLITQRQAEEALILVQRQRRDALIELLEAERRRKEVSDNLNKDVEIAGIDEQIAGLRNLGAELTRAEQLRKRFAEQGVLDHTRLNEGVEDLLAEQKGITEILRDFRSNQVQDVFGLIERGVDKLTTKLGILGDAFGQLLKDILKLGATEIFKKILGINSSGQQFAFAGGPQSNAFNPLSLLNGGQTATGSGGGASISNLLNFRTPNFNPNVGTSGASSGGFNIGGLIGRSTLSRIPLIGKLFGGGASAASAAASGATSTGTGVFAGVASGASSAGPALAGAGLFAKLGGFFTNPVTAIIGGGIIGGLLLSKLFGGGEFKKFKDEVARAYQIKVSGDKEGKGLFEQSKQIGEQAFGKGQFGKRMAEVIRIEQIKRLIASYGEATNQQSELVRRTIAEREIVDVNNSANQFTRRAFGGRVSGGKPVIVGDGGRSEIYVPNSNGYVFPSLQAYERQMIQAMQRSQVLNGLFDGQREQQRMQELQRNQVLSGLYNGGQQAAAQFQERAQAPQQAPQQDGKQFEMVARAIQALAYQQRKLEAQMARIDAIPDDSLVGRMSPRDLAQRTADGMASDQTARRSMQEAIAS